MPERFESLSARLTAGFARLALTLFFRRVEVVGAENVPLHGPLVVVANHPNGLLDPVMLVGLLPRRIRFLGKSTLWRIPPLRPYLALAGVIPVYRPTDPGVDPSRNSETFARCREVLLEGGAIAIFPEGRSHSEPWLEPLKTGAARIAVGAVDAAEARAGQAPAGRPEPILMLPVGLTFDERERFRSRVLMVVGRPFDAAAAAREPAPGAAGDTAAAGPRDGPDGADPARVRAVTAALERGLADVTVTYRSWDEARLLARAVELFDRPEVALPGERSLAETHRLAQLLARRLEEVRVAFPEETRRVAAITERYHRMLRTLGLRDDQVAARYPRLRAVRWALGKLVSVSLGLTIALVGTLLSYVPYKVVGRIASRPALAREVQATWKLFGALFLYPVAWAAEAGAAAWWASRAGWPRPWLAALVVGIAAPVTGWVAILVFERGRRLIEEVGAYLMLRGDTARRRRLLAAREEVRSGVRRLAELYATQRPG